MKTFIAFLLTSLLVLQPQAANVVVNVHDISAGVVANRTVTVTLTKPTGAAVSGSWLFAGDSVSQRTDTNGLTTFSNLLTVGEYRLDVSGNPSRSFPFNISSTNGTYNVIQLFGTNQAVEMFYDTAQIDAMLANIGGGSATNVSLASGTNVIIGTNSSSSWTVNFRLDGTNTWSGTNSFTNAFNRLSGTQGTNHGGFWIDDVLNGGGIVQLVSTGGVLRVFDNSGAAADMGALRFFATNQGSIGGNTPLNGGFIGDGQGISNLYAGNIAGGTVSSLRLPIIPPDKLGGTNGATDGQAWTLDHGTNKLVTIVGGGGGDVSQAGQNNLTGSNSFAGVTLHSNNVSIDAAHQLSLSNLTAQSIAMTDAGNRITNLLNGGANKFIQGTTPPTYTSIPDAALSANVALLNANNALSGSNNAAGVLRSEKQLLFRKVTLNSGDTNTVDFSTNAYYEMVVTSTAPRLTIIGVSNEQVGATLVLSNKIAGPVLTLINVDRGANSLDPQTSLPAIDTYAGAINALYFTKEHGQVIVSLRGSDNTNTASLANSPVADGFWVQASGSGRFVGTNTLVTNNAATSNNRVQVGDGGRGIKDSTASGAVSINADGTATTSSQINTLFPGTVHTNGMSVLANFSNSVAVDATHQLFLTNATASRILLTDANQGVTNANASGAIPIDANGTATTFAQVAVLAPSGSEFMTNGESTAVTFSNKVTITGSGDNGVDAIYVTNLTASRSVLTDANKKLVSAAASGAVPMDADGSAATFAQVAALAPSGSQFVTNGESVAVTLSNTVTHIGDVKVGALNQLSVSNATASRLLITDAANRVTNALASGAVPIDADGSATTFAQVNTLAPGTVHTNGMSVFASFSNVVAFAEPNSIYGETRAWYANTNYGPSIDPFNGYFRFLGGNSLGFQWLKYDGTATYMSAGYFSTAARAENVIRTPVDSGTVQNSFGIDEGYGAAVNTWFPYLGANAGAVTALPLNGPEIGIRLPIPPAVFYPSDVLSSTNSETENYITNLVQQATVKAIKNVFTNWGIATWVETEHWMSPNRDGNGNLQTLAAQYPDPIGWIARYVQTNGFGLQLHIDWTSKIINGASGTYPFAYQTMSPQTINRDINYFYTNGINAIRVGDGVSGDPQDSANYIHQMQRCIADKLIYPNGKLWSVQTGFTNPIVFDCFIYDPLRVGLVIDSPYMVNNFADDQGRGGSGANDISQPLYQMRLTWTNYARLASKGHYFSGVYVSDQYKSTPDFQTFLAAQVMFPGPLSFFSNSVHATYGPMWTNYNFLKLFTDVAQEPAFRVYDGGTNGASCWVKPLAGGSFALMLANETGSSSNMTVNWSQIVSPNGFSPVGTTLYPISIPTNAPFNFTEVWATNNLGSFSGTFTQSIGAHSSGFYRMDPIGLGDITLGPISTNLHRVYRSPVLVAGSTFLTISNTAYFIYMGRVASNCVPSAAEVHITTGGAGTQNAEIGFFSTPAPPNKASQSLTKLVTTGTLTANMTSSGVITKNNSAFATTINAGTFLWVGFRTGMVTTQPTCVGVSYDMSEGNILTTASSGLLTGAGPFTGSLPALGAATVGPEIRMTIDQ